jgi:hypothetical protein
LLRTFKGGSRIDDAFETVYGFDQLGLENEWRASVGLPARVASPTATPPPEAHGESTTAPDEPSGSSTSGGGGSANDAIAYIVIGLLAIATLGTVVYSARTIRSRLP